MNSFDKPTNGLIFSNDSTLVIQYLSVLELEWRKRQELLECHVRNFTDLVRIDQCIQSSLNALIKLYGRNNSILAKHLEAEPRPSKTFALTACALNCRDERVLTTCLGLMQSLPQHRLPFWSALAWAKSEQIQWAFPYWPHNLDLRTTSLAVLGAGHPSLRLNIQWPIMANDSDEQNLAMMQFALTRRDLDIKSAADLAVKILSKPNLPAQCAAADFLLSNKQSGYHDIALKTLAKMVQIPSVSQRESVFLLVSHAPNVLSKLLEVLRVSDPTGRLSIEAMGWSGLLSQVDPLVAYLNHPELARLSGAMLGLLTGSEPARDRWGKPLTESTRQGAVGTSNTTSVLHHSTIDPELPIPDKGRFEEWWAKNGANYDMSRRHFGGLPESPGNLFALLRSGKLAWRRLAIYRLRKLNAVLPISTKLPAATQIIEIKNSEEMTANRASIHH